MNNPENIEFNGNGFDDGLPRPENPHSVPEGYFEGLAGSIMSRIRSMEGEAASEIENLSPLLAGISRQMPYEVPEGYFQRITHEALTIVGPEPELTVLSTVTRHMPYELPAGYFESLPQHIASKVAPARVVSMARPRWMRMAIAAAVTGLVAVGGYFYAMRGTGNSDNSLPIAGQLKGVSNTELDEFIKTTDYNGASSGQTAMGRKPAKAEVKELLKDVSDKELESFLNQVPTDDEDLYVIN
jgi:hypothetical protein